MQFLAPLWLALGAAAAVPLLLHLWRRRSGERVLFPAVRLLAAATEARGATVRLREWLLLALRVLAVLLIALAAARPAVGGHVGARAPAALALVLDNSLSTSAVVGGRPVLDALRDQLRAALASAVPGDRLWLVTADGAVTAGDRATIRAALDATRPIAGAGDVPAALRRAAALAAGARPGRAGDPAAVVLATDAQATTWPRPVPVSGVRVGVVRAAGAAPADRAVVALDAEPARWSPDGTVVGRLTAAGDWHLTLRDSAGRTAAESRGSAAAADSFAVRAAVRPAVRGWLAGTLDLPPDELRGDDARHLAVYVGAPPALAADPSAGPFAAVGVATLLEGRALGAAAGAPPRVTEPGPATRLPAILVAPADPARLPAANRALDRLGVPWRLGAAPTAPATATVRLGAGAPAASAAPVPVARRWRLDPAGAPLGATDTVAAVAGEPWSVAGTARTGAYVLLASPLDTSWTPFPARAAFLPWLAASAARLADPAGVASRPQHAAPGASVPGASVPVPPGVDALLTPTGPRPVRDARTAAPAEPGVYFWLRSGARVGALVVDPEADEVVLARLDPKALGEQIRASGGGAVEVTATGADAAAFALGAGGRRSLAGLLAAAAALLLAGEAFAARPTPAGARGTV